LLYYLVVSVPSWRVAFILDWIRVKTIHIVTTYVVYTTLYASIS
jgi:hypothetical protein